MPNYTLTLTPELDALAAGVAEQRGLAGVAELIEQIAAEQVTQIVRDAARQAADEAKRAADSAADAKIAAAAQGLSVAADGA